MKRESPPTMFIPLMSVDLFMLGGLRQDEATYSPHATQKPAGGLAKHVALKYCLGSSAVMELEPRQESDTRKLKSRDLWAHRTRGLARASGIQKGQVAWGSG